MHGAEAAPAPAQTPEEVLVRLWNDVINTVNKILDVDKRFGFSKFQSSIDPSIDQIVHSLGIIEPVFNSFLDSGLLEHDEVRQALNSKQCVLHIRRLAVALRDNDKGEYEKTIALLNSQAQI